MPRLTLLMSSFTLLPAWCALPLKKADTLDPTPPCCCPARRYMYLHPHTSLAGSCREAANSPLPVVGWESCVGKRYLTQQLRHLQRSRCFGIEHNVCLPGLSGPTEGGWANGSAAAAMLFASEWPASSWWDSAGEWTGLPGGSCTRSLTPAFLLSAYKRQHCTCWASASPGRSGYAVTPVSHCAGQLIGRNFRFG